MTLHVLSLDHLVINVSNVETSAAWFEKVLGMVRETGDRARTAMQFGAQKINLRPISASQDEWFTAREAVPGSEDLCFLTESAPESVIEHLGRCGVAVELGPVEKKGARGVLLSVYCRDPDGSLIEISSFAK